MKRRPYTIIVAKRVREKAEAFFETHEELIPRFQQLMQEIRLTPLRRRRLPAPPDPRAAPHQLLEPPFG